MNLVQVSRFVAVCGPSGCGKTAAIQVAAETFRHASSFSQIRCISTTTIAVGAMREEQLMGYQCQTKGCVMVQLVAGIATEIIFYSEEIVEA